MDSCWRLITLLLFGTICNPARGQNALTDDEIATLRANNFTVTIATDTITLAHHGLPEHTSEGGWGNPNNATVVNHSYTLPRGSTVSEPKGCAGGLGVIGLAVSGGAFYNPYTGFGWNAVEGECKEDLDTCYGHPSPDGAYHYHSLPDCLYTGELRNKFLGVALDGYPIYGPMDETGKNWTTAELDQCHGHYYKGRYMYRATAEFPYILSCYHGNSVKVNPPAGGGGGMLPPPNGGGGNMPPPPPGRRRRHAADHDLHRRQIQMPPGHENDPCWKAETQNWSVLTCIVICENAGRDLSNCPSRSRLVNGTGNPTGGSVTQSTTVVAILGLCLIVYSILTILS